jgi:thioredoxin reductase (NADPH)
MVDYDLIIIGCGPAGMNACLYASRSKLKTLVIERNCPGGKVIKANVVENWIGTEKISGVDLSLQMFKHSFSYGGVYEQGNVLDIVDYDNYKEVVLKDKMYKCHAVIIAIGTSEKKLGILGEEKFYAKGVSYCAVCDASLYKDKDMVVIGNTNHALEEVSYLTKFAKKIYLVNQSNKFIANESLVKEIEGNNKIEILYNSAVIRINGNEAVESITIKKENIEEEIKTSVVFPLLGDNPDTKFIERLNLVDEKGYVIVDENKGTKVPGIYAIGDCTTTQLKQIVTAAGDGALAAIQAYKYIKSIK